MTPILGIWASQISGHLWAPAGAYDALATVTVPSGGAASITFAGIPTGYKHLQIRYLGRSTQASSELDVNVICNSDSASSYTNHQLYGDGSSAGSNYFGGTPRTYMTLGLVAGASATSGIFGAGIMDVLDYASTSKYKTFRALSGDDRNGSGTIIFRSGAWMSTSAISSMTITTTSNFAEYSQFSLYGIK